MTSQKYAVTEVNKQINNTYNDIIDRLGLTQQSLALQNNSGYVTANNVVINKICGEMAYQISDNLNKIEDKKIKIPLGLFFYSNIFSELGPSMNMGIHSMGDAKVDYNSSFTACGINQVNYKLWLDVECEVAVVSPIVNKNMIIKRKIIAIDMIYNGGIPNSYLNLER